MIAVVVLDKAVYAQKVERLLKELFAHRFVLFEQLVVGVPFALLHGQRDVDLVLVQDLTKTPVFLVRRFETEQLVGHVVRDLCAELCILFLTYLFAVILGFGAWILIVGFRHGFSPLY